MQLYYFRLQASFSALLYLFKTDWFFCFAEKLYQVPASHSEQIWNHTVDLDIGRLKNLVNPSFYSA